MNAPLSSAQREALARIAADARAMLDAPADAPKREPLAPRIRELALAGLGDAAIAAETGAPFTTVQRTLSRARAVMKLPIATGPQRRRAACVLRLDAATGTALALAAARAGVGPDELAATLIGAGLAKP